MENLKQPETIEVSDCIRLNKFTALTPELTARALVWYQDAETVRLVDGPEAQPYTPEGLGGMYGYLANKGELYWIEADMGDGFMPIGDVSLLPDGDMPIVIGDPSCRGKGIGRAVISALMNRAEALGFEKMTISDIYGYNTGSQRLFASCGFREGEATHHGHKYTLDMSRKLYIAYGSNMNTQQMSVRCPGAKPLGAGELRDYRLLFRKGGKGVYLTVEPEPGHSVPVAVWEIGPGSELALDEYEVYPSLYYKKKVTVSFTHRETGQTQTAPALVYVMCEGHPIAPTGQDYLEACAAGYRAFGLDPAPLYEAQEYCRAHQEG